LDIFTRTKPTKHKQTCYYCSKSFEKGEEQTLWQEQDWYCGHIYTSTQYFHPKCAMKEALSHSGLPKHFIHAYNKQLDAKSFKAVFDSNDWKVYSAQYIINPFKTLQSLTLNKKEQRKFLEEIFTEIVFEKLMNSESI